jgi:hypothetical protein
MDDVTRAPANFVRRNQHGGQSDFGCRYPDAGVPTAAYRLRTRQVYLSLVAVITKFQFLSAFGMPYQ